MCNSGFSSPGPRLGMKITSGCGYTKTSSPRVPPSCARSLASSVVHCGWPVRSTASAGIGMGSWSSGTALETIEHLLTSRPRMIPLYHFGHLVIWALGRAGGLVRVGLRSPGLEEVQEDPDGCPAADEASTQPPARLQLLCIRAAGMRFFVHIRRRGCALGSCVKYPADIKIADQLNVYRFILEPGWGQLAVLYGGG